MLKNKGSLFRYFVISLFRLICFSLLCSICFAQEPQEASKKVEKKSTEFEYSAKDKRNPFIPLVTPDGKLLKLDVDPASKGLVLEGIIYDKFGISYAIINGSVVKIGDIVGDEQVLKIENNKVLLIKDGQVTEVGLRKEE